MHADDPPELPLGLDAYRQWHLWPLQRIGVRAYLRSTYDRTGHNHTADASHYLYQESEDFNVTLDLEGAGILYFVRTNRWHGSPWHYEIDGVDHIVEETTTPDPTTPLDDSVFVPEQLFPRPLAYTYATTKGADLNWVPMAFDERLRIAYSRTYYGTGYYIYHLFAERGVDPWQPEPPDEDVLALLDRAGEDIAPASGLTSSNGRVSVEPGEPVTLCRLAEGPAMIRRLTLSAPQAQATAFGNTTIRITWDDREFASVEAPVSLFFGAGTLHRTGNEEWLVKALPVSIRFAGEHIELACYIPMPFFESANIELVGDAGIDDVEWSVATEPYDGPFNHVGYFHATYRDHGTGQFGHDLEFVDTKGIEGARDWSGSIIGTSFVFTDRNVLTTLEGDPRFYFDDSQTPQVQGTGTEEWGGGGDYWGGRTMTLPLAGHPTGVVDDTAATDPLDSIHSAYRFLVADLMPFGRRARVCFEHGGENEAVEHYRSVTYWYGLPSPSLVETDVLDIGDPDSESAHAYRSPDATEPYDLTSRFEWGPDHLPTSMGGPLATPPDYIDFGFDAQRGTYELWMEACVGAELFDAAVWVEFGDDIGSATVHPAYMGSLGILNAGRTPGQFAFTTGRRPVSLVTFEQTGTQRLRVQPRHGTLRFSRIVLRPQGRDRPGGDFSREAGDIVLGPDDRQAIAGAWQVIEDAHAPVGIAFALSSAPDKIEIYPAHTLRGRRTTTWSTFKLAIEPDNHGVLLRRTLDYGYANQRARVFVFHDGEWEAAGIWYLAGSNTVYHSFPWTEGELAPVRPVVISSNRRFRDDEFLLSKRLTRGKDSLDIRLEFAPRNPPLLPHLDPAPTAWTEFAYHVSSYVMPKKDTSVPDKGDRKRDWKREDLYTRGSSR